MDAAGLQRGRLTALALKGEDLIDAEQVAQQISLDTAREARLACCLTRPDGHDVPTGCRTGHTSKPSTNPFAARGIPPGSVRQGWFYALIGMSLQDVLLYTVPPTFRTIFPTPQDVAEVAEQLVRFRTVPDVEHRTEWDGSAAVRAAARDYRRTVCGLAPVGRQKHEAGTRMESEITEISDPCSVDVWEGEGGACVGVDRPSAPYVGWGAVPVGTDPSPEIGTCTARAVDVTPIRPDVVSDPGAIDTWGGEGGALPGRVRAAGERGADDPYAVHPAAPEWAPVPGTNRRTTELTCAGRQYRVYHAPDAVLPYTVRYTLGGAVVDLGGCVGLDDVRAIVRADRRRGAALEAERRRIEQEQRRAAYRLQGERRQATVRLTAEDRLAIARRTEGKHPPVAAELYVSPITGKAVLAWVCGTCNTTHDDHLWRPQTIGGSYTPLSVERETLAALVEKRGWTVTGTWTAHGTRGDTMRARIAPTPGLPRMGGCDLRVGPGHARGGGGGAHRPPSSGDGGTWSARKGTATNSPAGRR